MLYTEQMKQTLEKFGVDTTQLPDNLYSTLLDVLSNSSGGGGYDDTEIRNYILDLQDNKLDKVTGKGLSTNDFTTEEKQKLAGLENYDDTELYNAVNQKADKTDVYTKNETDEKITSKVAEIVANAPEDFDTLKEMSDWIAGHENDAAAMNSAIQTNAGNISDLQTNKANVSDLDNYMLKSEITAITNDEIDAIMAE